MLPRKRPTVLDDQQARDTLLLDRLGAYGIAAADFSHVVANARGGRMQSYPIVLTDGEIEQILARRV